MDEMRVVEIKGAKFEVDMREAITVQTLKIGDRVSVLLKTYSSNYEVKHGVVVGFEPFRELPTVLVAYLTNEYTGGEIKILAWNDKTQDTDLVKSVDDVLFSKEEALAALDKKIDDAKAKVTEAEAHKAYFLRHFGAYWREVAVEEPSP